MTAPVRSRALQLGEWSNTTGIKILGARLMTWLRESESFTREALDSDTFSAIRQPMAISPFQWTRSVLACLARRLCWSMKGSSTKNENTMWEKVRNSGMPVAARTVLFTRFRPKLAAKYKAANDTRYSPGELSLVTIAGASELACSNGAHCSDGDVTLFDS